MTDLPPWDHFMAPVLRALSDGQTLRRRELYSAVADAEDLTTEQLAERLESGHLRYENRIGWATSRLDGIGALERPVRGQYVITDIGRQLLVDHPAGFLDRDVRHLVPNKIDSAESVAVEGDQFELDPVEQVEQGIARIQAGIAVELLTRLHDREPAFFEQAVLDLLMAMGYGGADGVATRTQLVGDGGIDGIIDQDALGLSRVYVQAKRYALDSSVGRPEVQGFVGALHGNQANQGVFITTGRFSPGATSYAGSVPTRVVLVDGKRLAALMIRYGVGVQVKRTLQIIDIDEDFFE